MKTTLPLVLALLSSPLAAQVPAAAPKVVPQPAPSSCADARQLETTFIVTLTRADGQAQRLTMAYSGCTEHERNDYLPPYTERQYTGAAGYGLTIVTNEGQANSQVLLSQGRDWLGDFGAISNAALASAKRMTLGDSKTKDGKAKTEIKGLLYPQTLACEAAMSKEFGQIRDGDGNPSLGYERGTGLSLILLNSEAAYYYHEDCDICAAVEKCALKSTEVRTVITAHMVDCADMAKYKQGTPVYDACAR
jgi:hypothetical protein